MLDLLSTFASHVPATAAGAVGEDQGLTNSAGGALGCVAPATQTNMSKQIKAKYNKNAIHIHSLACVLGRLRSAFAIKPLLECLAPIADEVRACLQKHFAWRRVTVWPYRKIVLDRMHSQDLSRVWWIGCKETGWPEC